VKSVKVKKIMERHHPQYLYTVGPDEEWVLLLLLLFVGWD
jgi:hypothetical protein